MPTTSKFKTKVVDAMLRGTKMRKRHPGKVLFKIESVRPLIVSAKLESDLVWYDFGRHVLNKGSTLQLDTHITLDVKDN